MIVKLENFKPYTQTADGIRLLRRDRQYMITYFPENSNLFDDYLHFGLRAQELRYAIVPLTKIPRTGLLPATKGLYKKIRLNAYQSNIKPPAKQNIIYDCSIYSTAVEKFYKSLQFRQRAGVLIKGNAYRSIDLFPSFTKIFMYGVDLDKPFSKNIVNRKIFLIIRDIKAGVFPFDYFVLSILQGGKCRHRLLMADGVYNFNRLYLFLRNVMPHMTHKDIEDMHKDVDEQLDNEEIEKDIESHDIATVVIKNAPVEVVPEEKKNEIHTAVKQYLKKSDDVRQDLKIKSDMGMSKPEASRAVIKSVIYSATKNLSHANKIVDKLDDKKIEKVSAAVKKAYTDQLVTKTPSKNTSTDHIVIAADVPSLVDNKNPSHLLEKRAIDFHTNLKNDIHESFKIFENQEVPLKIKSFEIVESPQRKGELSQSDVNTVVVTLKKNDGSEQEVLIDIPRINFKTGTFRIYGETKCLINQIVLCPITFPKRYDSLFHSSYSKFHIYSKITKTRKYLQIYMGSFKSLPLLIVLAYAFGWDRVMEKYGMKYTLVSEAPGKAETRPYIRIDTNQYVIFDNVNNDLKVQLIEAVIVENIYKYKPKAVFGTKDYFADLLQEITGSISSTYLISDNIKYLVDPASKQVLINQGLPFELEEIMYYMTYHVVSGKVIERNDLSNQRIRGSEVISMLIRDQLKSAYTTYRMKVMSGDKSAKFDINRTQLLSEFLKTEIVTNMEYANPIEEMATMTRISPVGKHIGGVATPAALTGKARNVHDTYFGNIDPVDTPEGENIGVTQQLAMGAEITNARGLFGKKDIDDKEGSGILSTSSALIPFVGSNDGGRIIMADSQIKQMLPLKNPEPPIVMTGYESILTTSLSENFVKKAPYDCMIVEVTEDYIKIKNRSGKSDAIDISPIHLKSGFGRDTLSVFVPLVKKGLYVKQGTLLAEGSCIKDGSISLGKTLLTAYMPYKGYNFEDGIVISNKLAQSEKLTSLHGVIEEIDVSDKDRVLYIAKIGEYIEAGNPLIRKTIGELEELLGYSEDDDSVVVYGQEMIKKSPGGTIVDIEVFSNIPIDRYPLLKELSVKTRSRYGMAANEKFSDRRKTLKGITIKFKIQQELKIGLGDKLTGRYGNKGVVCLIEDDDKMPKTPWNENLDIILNPLGVIGRMNMGQIFELYCGLIAKAMAIRIGAARNKSQIMAVFRTVLPLLDNTKNFEYSKKTVATLAGLSEQNFLAMVNSIKKNGFVPIIVPPFKSPTHKQIHMAMKALGLSDGYNLFLPDLGINTKSKVPVGYSYITKLEHMGDLKAHVRSTGPTTATRQPTQGKSREGGQRLGEQDSYAIMGYNAPHLLSELMGPLSDDQRSRDEMISEIITSGAATFRVSTESMARDFMGAYLIGLLLDSRESKLK